MLSKVLMNYFLTPAHRLNYCRLTKSRSFVFCNIPCDASSVNSMRVVGDSMLGCVKGIPEETGSEAQKECHLGNEISIKKILVTWAYSTSI